MPLSMTGYGRGQAAAPDRLVTAEVRSLNHRFLEVVVRLPRGWLAMEGRVRQMVKGSLQRGRVEVFVSETTSKSKRDRVKVDKELALAYYGYLKDLAHNLDVPADFGVMGLTGLPGVIELADEEGEPPWPLVEAAVRQALAGVGLFRQQEGERLVADLRQRVAQLADLVNGVEERLPAALEEFRRRLEERVAELVGPGSFVDADRLATEVALLAAKGGITEELVRLRSHLDQVTAALNEGTVAVGRRLDFLSQELLREANTIASKSTDPVLDRFVIAMKVEIENLREQVQNLE